MKKAIFLDRDGTLNIDIGYAYKIEDCFLVEEGIGSILQKFKDKGYLLVITTNQSGIDKGFYKKEDFDLFMIELEIKLNIKFDGIYHCPYHPDFTGLLKCRKPNNGMILQAKKDLNINLEKSYMIGDNFKDVESGKLSNCITILINTQNLNTDNLEVKPDFIVSKWNKIEKIILDN